MGSSPIPGTNKFSWGSGEPEPRFYSRQPVQGGLIAVTQTKGYSSVCPTSRRFSLVPNLRHHHASGTIPIRPTHAIPGPLHQRQRSIRVH